MKEPHAIKLAYALAILASLATLALDLLVWRPN